MLQESKTSELEYQKLSKDEMEQRGILGRLVGICADFMSPTRNGRKYPEKLWENVFNDPIMKERIDNGVCYGELGHPADREETDMEKIAVCMSEQPKKGSDGKLRAVFDILNTPNGRILKSLCDYGSTLGISSRGSGDLETDFDGNESVNPDTYNCEGFDVVLIPAVKEARLKYVTESLQLNEGAIYPKSKINLEAREFNYTMHYGDDSQDIHSAVVVIPNGIKFKDGSTMDATVYCEDVNGTVINFTSVEEAQEWIDNYGDSCVYYVVNGDELHATPQDAYDISKATTLESIDLNKKRYNKTLREKLTESINKETVDHQKIVKESLDALGINLKEDIQYGDSSINITQGGAQVRTSDGKFVQEFPTEEEAREWIDDSKPLDECVKKEDIVADSNDGAIVEELQKAMSLNKKLDEKITALQEKLSVSYAKEMKLEETLENYKVRVTKLSRSLAESRGLVEKLNTVNDTNKSINEKCKKLTESVKKRDGKIAKINESVTRKDKAIKTLQEKLKEVNSKLEEQKQNNESLKEKYDILNGDYQQFKESYSRKTEQQNELIEKYRGVAVKSVNRYINAQATKLGVQPSEIKNRLPESYSFSDIDKICEDLQEYKLNMSNLPFSTGNRALKENVQLKAKNINSFPFVQSDDEIDELTLRLAKL